LLETQEEEEREELRPFNQPGENPYTNKAAARLWYARRLGTMKKIRQLGKSRTETTPTIKQLGQKHALIAKNFGKPIIKKYGHELFPRVTELEGTTIRFN